MSKPLTLLRAPLGVAGGIMLAVGLIGMLATAAEHLGWAVFWMFFTMSIIGGAGVGVAWELDSRSHGSGRYRW